MIEHREDEIGVIASFRGRAHAEDEFRREVVIDPLIRMGAGFMDFVYDYHVERVFRKLL